MTNFVVDARDLIGKRITISSCEIKYSSVMAVACTAEQGQVMLDPQSMSHDALLRALQRCSSANVGISVSAHLPLGAGGWLVGAKSG